MSPASVFVYFSVLIVPIQGGFILEEDRLIFRQELGALFFNMKDATPFREALEEMGHPQPPTPIVVDNSTAAGVANKTVKQRRSKAMDMRFYWVQDRIEQKQFLVYWRKGAENLADYFTKHHPARYHVQMRPVYLHSNSTSNSHH